MRNDKNVPEDIKVRVRKTLGASKI